jgi:hypothetical protein
MRLAFRAIRARPPIRSLPTRGPVSIRLISERTCKQLTVGVDGFKRHSDDRQRKRLVQHCGSNW